MKINTRRPKRWSLVWFAQQIASFILLLGAVLAAAAALTALIIAIEEITALIVLQRPINTYTNVYGNAVQTVIWHFLMVFSLVGYWAALDTFTPEPDSYDKKD